MSQTLDTMIEFVQGCVPNQLTILNENVIDDLNFIIRRHKYDKCRLYQVEVYYYQMNRVIVIFI